MSLKRRTSLRIGSIISASASTLRDPFERLGNSGSTPSSGLAQQNRVRDLTLPTRWVGAAGESVFEPQEGTSAPMSNVGAI